MNLGQFKHNFTQEVAGSITAILLIFEKQMVTEFSENI